MKNLMKIIPWIIACLQLTLILDHQVVYAQIKGLPEVAASAIGLTPSGIKSLDSLMERYTKPDRFPCAMLMVARDGKIGYWKAFGVRDLDTKIKLDRNDAFRIYSITKPVTAVAAMMLWEQGKIGLDDPVEKYIPSFADIQVLDEKGYRKPLRPMTIRHLLTFTSGLTYGTFPPFTKADSVVAAARLFQNATSLSDLVERNSKLPLVNDPGEGTSYGFQTDVLGRIVEVVSGMSLDKFFKQNIFTPLGMSETDVTIPDKLLTRFPSLYWLSKEDSPGKVDAGDSTSSFHKAARADLGGGSLLSTLSDYARFAQMLANKGELNGKRILKASTIEMMTTPNIIKDLSRQNSLQGPGWLPGFQVLVAPDIHATTGGGHDGLYWCSGAANLYFWVDPSTNIVALIWTQSLPYKVFPIFDDARKVVHSAFKDSK